MIPMRRNSTGRLASAAVCILVATSALALDAAPKCESGKLKESARYAQCRLMAESKAARKGEAADYGRCEQKFADKWATIEAKAGMATCPSEGDQATVSDYLDDCTSRAALWLAGDGGLPDTCASDLATCQGDLATCPGDLATCQATQGVPVTGQTSAYGAGSDGELERGAARSFTDNGDGTITDNTTGLMWEKKSNDGSVHDMSNSYTWSTGTNDMDGTMVTTFLATLNSGGGFAGYTDWRIPNLNELHSLLNFEIAYPGPPVFAEFSSACTSGCTVTTCSCTSTGNHWSSTTYQQNASSAWFAYFSDGATYDDTKTTAHRVRAVRGGY